MKGYSITLTTSRDFTPDELEGFCEFFRHNCDSCLLVEERGQRGQLHLHAGTKQKQSQTHEVTRLLARHYELHEIPFQKGVSIKVKKTCDQIGWFHYLIKDIPKDSVPLLIFGWKMTWIQEQCRANLKKVPHKIVKGTDYNVNMLIATNLVIQYAKTVGLPLSGKGMFMECICQMAEAGYLFHNVKFKILYCQVMARFHERRPMLSFLTMELQYLD